MLELCRFNILGDIQTTVKPIYLIFHQKSLNAEIFKPPGPNFDFAQLGLHWFLNIFESIEPRELQRSLKFSSWQELSGKTKSFEIEWVGAKI